jgi:ribose transport system ATP-binding protein
VIYISHTLDDVFKICDEIAVLRDGRLIDQKDIQNTTKDEVITMMVGRKMENLFPYVEKKTGGQIFEVTGLNQKNRLKDISFSINSGEIVGMFGLMGAGRSELARALYGLDPIDSGSISFKGEENNILNPITWKDKGVAYITENRREEGLLLPKPVRDNLILAKLKKMRKRLGSMDFKKADEDSSRIINKLQIKINNKTRQTVGLLSGGNQQKVVIGKWLLIDPELLIMDEPTRGVDVGAKYEIYNYVNDLALKGAGILFISSEMEELIGICDRILVMSKGRITGKLLRKDFSQEKIIRYAIGGGMS